MKKKLLVLLIILFSNMQNYVQSQPDYLNESEYKRFRYRRILVANWQIYQLADSGALVIRLKSNKKVIDILKKNNQNATAKELEKSTQDLNKKIIRAFVHQYTFSKYYFMYDYFSDSLLKGARKNIFLDTNLNINPTITMSEKFYLIAEKDNVVQSSIGFVTEQEAQQITETGAPVKEVAIVIKNKYGIQLKSPFPFYVAGTNPDKYNIYISKLNAHLIKFKNKNPRQIYPPDVKPYLY